MNEYEYEKRVSNNNQHCYIINPKYGTLNGSVSATVGGARGEYHM